MKRTALYEIHNKLGAKMVEFAGWEMPLSYTGTLEEHRAVRESVGLFDVSHLGRASLEGKGGGRRSAFSYALTRATRRRILNGFRPTCLPDRQVPVRILPGFSISPTTCPS